jgi:hypothetical protein
MFYRMMDNLGMFSVRFVVCWSVMLLCHMMRRLMMGWLMGGFMVSGNMSWRRRNRIGWFL